MSPAAVHKLNDRSVVLLPHTCSAILARDIDTRAWPVPKIILPGESDFVGYFVSESSKTANVVEVDN